MGDIDLVEIRQRHCASVVLSWAQLLQRRYGQEVNVNGGAIALGIQWAYGRSAITHHHCMSLSTDQSTALITMCAGGRCPPPSSADLS